MDGYSEIGSIYFSRGKKTAFAKLPKILNENKDFESQLICASYEGAPPYKKLNSKLPIALREYHCAEHKTYNAFHHKIKNLMPNTDIKELSKHLPNLDEIKKTQPHALFCGTTFLLSSGLVLIISSLPNIVKFHNTNIYFMLPWMAGSILITFFISKFIQKKFFLSPAKDYQLLLARAALKEALKHD